jgi:radical SAM-linked protein
VEFCIIVSLSGSCARESQARAHLTGKELGLLLKEEFLPLVHKPGQYLGNEWGARQNAFSQARVRMALAFPDLYELGMSNFGLKILYQLVNNLDGYMVDRSYAPASDLEALLLAKELPLFAYESKEPLKHFELVGFSLQYELTYTNVLNMLKLAQLPVLASERKNMWPLVFGGGPSAVNPEPMAQFMDFFIIGDGEEAIPAVLGLVENFKEVYASLLAKMEAGLLKEQETRALKELVLTKIAQSVPGVYVPALYEVRPDSPKVMPLGTAELLPQWEKVLALHLVPDFWSQEKAALGEGVIPERVERQVCALSDVNQPTANLVPYLALVHDRETLEVRRGCDRGCRFCQPGYTFLPVRERSAEDLVRLSKQALANSGHEEYSLLSLCVSDYTSLQESVRALNREHSANRTSLSFPSQRADRMNLDVAEELKVVRKSGITLAPEAGTEKLRKVINKGLSHEQIINAIDSAYQGGWQSVKLYFMCGLPFEDDSDLQGIVEILKEATNHARHTARQNPEKYKRRLELTCTISNFVPKPFTPFQWFAQISPEETKRRHGVLRAALKEARLNGSVTFNTTDPQISLLEAVVSRGSRLVGDLIHRAWLKGAAFDAWDEHFKPALWHEAAGELGTSLEELACTPREPGSWQAYDVVHIGLHHWWLKREWEKAEKEVETAPCTENNCHACGICTELETHHVLTKVSEITLKKNPFVKELNANKSDEESHPSLFFLGKSEKASAPLTEERSKLRFTFKKTGDLRFIGHLDLQNLFIRAIRRAGLDLSYTQGFNPSPRLAFACPLPIFQESLEEIAEIELNSPLAPQAMIARLNEQLPQEIQLLQAKPSALGQASLASTVGFASYEARPALPYVLNSEGQLPIWLDSPSALLSYFKQRISLALESREILLEKTSGKPQGKTSQVNIRSLISSLDLSTGEDGLLKLVFCVATGSKGHLKPNDLLDYLTDGLALNWRITRLKLFSSDLSAISDTTIVDLGGSVIDSKLHLTLTKGS